jgi:hypothetical protein
MLLDAGKAVANLLASYRTHSPGAAPKPAPAGVPPNRVLHHRLQPQSPGKDAFWSTLGEAEPENVATSGSILHFASPTQVPAATRGGRGARGRAEAQNGARCRGGVEVAGGGTGARGRGGGDRSVRPAVGRRAAGRRMGSTWPVGGARGEATGAAWAAAWAARGNGRRRENVKKIRRKIEKIEKIRVIWTFYPFIQYEEAICQTFSKWLQFHQRSRSTG